jgi:hypothetical protein
MLVEVKLRMSDNWRRLLVVALTQEQLKERTTQNGWLKANINII